jgi:uncharacterized membrane protein YheB (UPF0754 family)
LLSCKDIEGIIMSEFKINIDTNDLMKQAEQSAKTKFANLANEVINYIIFNIFHDSPLRGKGIGNQHLEEQILKMLSGEESERILQDFYKNNWERILQESMEKAMRHKANALAFGSLRNIKD